MRAAARAAASWEFPPAGRVPGSGHPLAGRSPVSLHAPSPYLPLVTTNRHRYASPGPCTPPSRKQTNSRNPCMTKCSSMTTPRQGAPVMLDLPGEVVGITLLRNRLSRAAGSGAGERLHVRPDPPAVLQLRRRPEHLGQPLPGIVRSPAAAGHDDVGHLPVAQCLAHARPLRG